MTQLSALTTLPVTPTHPSIAPFEPAAAQAPMISRVLRSTPTAQARVASIERDIPVGEDKVLYTQKGLSAPNAAVGARLRTSA